MEPTPPENVAPVSSGVGGDVHAATPPESDSARTAGVTTPTDGAAEEWPAPEEKPSHTTRTVVEWVVLIGAALLIALVIKAFLFQAFYIPSESMVPTLEKGDRVLVNKLSYKLHDVHRGDIVVFEAPPGTESSTIKDLVKRVVGLPGDTVELRDGHVFVNGDQLEEGYLPDGTTSTPICGGETKWEVPPDHVFVMGDNRGSSQDGRCFGPIPESHIVGRVFVRIWPLSRFKFF